MGDTALFGVVPPCDYAVTRVTCPLKRAEATVTAATWRLSRGGWAPWTVVDCTLQPAGAISCSMSCLAQVTSPGYAPGRSRG